MNRKPKQKVQKVSLTKEEEKYIDLLLKGKTKSEAIKTIWPKFKSVTRKINLLNDNQLIQSEIIRRKEINSYRVNYTQEDIVKSMWKEALNMEGNNQSARIQALVWLGKHIGMFQEKRLERSTGDIIYNVVQYQADTPKKEKIVKQETKRLNAAIPGIAIKDFKK